VIECYGDLWDFIPRAKKVDARVVATNGVVNKHGEAIMGRGSALEAQQRFPNIQYRLGELIRKKGSRVQVINDEKYALVAFPTKDDWRENSDLRLITRSTVQLANLADKKGWQVIVMPRVGAGAGNLKWDDVKRRIQGILDDRFYVITFAPDDRRLSI